MIVNLISSILLENLCLIRNGEYSKIIMHPECSLNATTIEELIQSTIGQKKIDIQPDVLSFEYYDYKNQSEYLGRLEYDIIHKNKKSDLTLIFDVKSNGDKIVLELYDLRVM